METVKFHAVKKYNKREVWHFIAASRRAERSIIIWIFVCENWEFPIFVSLEWKSVLIDLPTHPYEFWSM